MIIQECRLNSTIIKIDNRNIGTKEQTYEQINIIISLLIEKIQKLHK